MFFIKCNSDAARQKLFLLSFTSVGFPKLDWIGSYQVMRVEVVTVKFTTLTSSKLIPILKFTLHDV